MTGVARSLQGLVLSALTFLSGCGICDCTSAPEMPAGQGFSYNGNSWRVADDRASGSLQVTAVAPRLTGMGTIAEQRHLVGNMPPAEFRAAAMGWFATTGRFCTLDQGTATDLDVYQYNYTCWIPV